VKLLATVNEISANLWTLRRLDRAFQQKGHKAGESSSCFMATMATPQFFPQTASMAFGKVIQSSDSEFRILFHKLLKNKRFNHLYFM
jgi:hypothetical protein